MRTSSIAFATAAGTLATSILIAVGAAAQTTPTEQDIIDALQKHSDESGEFTKVRSLSGDRGVTVTGGETAVSVDRSEGELSLSIPRGSTTNHC